MPAEKITFMLFNSAGVPKADAAPTFGLYKDRSGANRTQPVIANLGLGLYGFEASELDVQAATAFVVNAGANAFSASGGTRVFGAAFLQSQPWFVQLFEDAAGALWTGAAPTIGAWRDFAGADDASKPTVVSVATGVWAFTPSAEDLEAGRAYRWDAPAGAYPSFPHGAAHFDPVGTPSDTLGEVVYAALIGDAAVFALIGDRVYPNKRPQGAALPLAVYSIISDVPYNSFTGAAQDRLSNARLQVDVYAKTYKEAHNISEAIENVIANFSSHDLSAVRDTVRDIYENVTQYHRVSTDYFVTR